VSVLKSFELSVLNLLTAGVFPKPQVERFYAKGELIDLHFTGVGYFLTLRHSELPDARTVLSDPSISGKVGDLLTGFIAFVENNELTLECFSYGDDTVPENYRELDIAIFV